MLKRTELKAEWDFMEGSSISNIANFKKCIIKAQIASVFRRSFFFQWTQGPNCKEIKTNW